MASRNYWKITHAAHLELSASRAFLWPGTELKYKANPRRPPGSGSGDISDSAGHIPEKWHQTAGHPSIISRTFPLNPQPDAPVTFLWWWEVWWWRGLVGVDGLGDHSNITGVHLQRVWLQCPLAWWRWSPFLMLKCDVVICRTKWLRAQWTDLD